MKYIPRTHYEHHRDIPDSLAHFILLCSDSESIMSHPIEEINGFIDMMDEMEYMKYSDHNPTKLEK